MAARFLLLQILTTNCVQKMAKITLAKKVKSLRADRNIGIRELGRLAGVSGMHISNIEKGKSSASPELIRKIAIALEADVDELMSLTNQVDPEVVDVINVNHDVVPSFLRLAKNLTPEQWAKLQKQVEKMNKDAS